MLKKQAVEELIGIVISGGTTRFKHCICLVLLQSRDAVLQLRLLKKNMTHLHKFPIPSPLSIVLWDNFIAFRANLMGTNWTQGENIFL